MSVTPDDLVPANPEVAAASLRWHPNRGRQRGSSTPQRQLPSRSCRGHEAHINAFATPAWTGEYHPFVFARLAYHK
jgi:hypothetical protein